MAAMSSYLEGQFITHVFRTGTFTKPTVLAIALCTTTPVSTDTGTLAGGVTSTGVEVANSNGYTRVTYNPLDANWAANSNGTTNNSSSITWASATGNWGTVVAVAICDNITYNTGNLLFAGTLSAAKVLSTNDTFSFASSGLTVSFS
jgi:hypothetical protein